MKAEIINALSPRTNRVVAFIALKNSDDEILAVDRVGLSPEQLEGDNSNRLKRYGKRLRQQYESGERREKFIGDSVEL